MDTSNRSPLSGLDPFEVLRLVRLAGAEVTEPDELLVKRILRSLPDTYQHQPGPAAPAVESDLVNTGVTVPVDELVEVWTLLDDEQELVATRRHRRLGFALMLKHYVRFGRFPRSANDFVGEVVEFVARQLDTDPARLDDYAWSGSTYEYHRAEIRHHLGYRMATVEDQADLTEWLSRHVARVDQRPDRLRSALHDEMRQRRIEAPTGGRVKRIVQSAMRTAEREWSERIARRIPPETRGRLLELLVDDDDDGDDLADDGNSSVLALIRSAPGNVSLTTMTAEIYKLYAVRSMELPDDLFVDVNAKILTGWRTRAAIEAPSHLRRHPEPVTVTLLAGLVYMRQREITDALVELLIATVHRIKARAERRVTKQLTADFKRVAGKENLLFKIAGAAIEAPDDAVRNVVFPAITGGEATLRELVREFEAKGTTYQDTVRTTLRASYTNHYRSGLVDLLDVLEFRSNNTRHRPVMDALRLIRRYARGRNLTYYPLGEQIPEHRGTSRKDWEPLVYRNDARGRQRVVRTVYEIVTFQALCDQLRCKEIWVDGADSFRNPDHDLPADFEERRTENYRELRQPLDPTDFIETLRTQMETELDALNTALPSLDWLDISDRKTGAIKLTKYEAAPEPTNLRRIKNEVQQRWGTIALVDILKETVLRTGCLDQIGAIVGAGNLDADVLAERLMLAIYAYGTNTGITAVAAGSGHAHHEDDLRYVRRRYLNKDTAQTIAINIANATFAARNTSIWGAGSTAVASDSTHFRSYDQNIFTEWHSRYGGRGVLIYWHVEHGSMVVHSQTLRASASEVHAMIEGALHHGTNMNIEGNYVDTHGQSLIGFGITRLLGFDLLPRIKQINRIKLHRPNRDQRDAYPLLQPAMSTPINWDLIEQNYDPMIKYATAIQQRTATTEAILRRFTRWASHPTYKAMIEVGKAQRTIFVARYLRLRELQREITEGLNIVESFNRANSIIYYGKGGEISSNRHDEHELSVLCLRILQAALVYVNTLMLQEIVDQHHWTTALTDHDRRGLTPLFWQHILPYGEVHLDMNTRLTISN